MDMEHSTEASTSSALGHIPSLTAGGEKQMNTHVSLCKCTQRIQISLVLTLCIQSVQVAGSLICWTPQLWAHEPQRPTAPSPVCRPALPQVQEHCLSHLVSLVVGSGFSDLLCPRDALIQTYQDIKSPRCPGLLSNLHRLGPFSSQVSDPLVSPISGPISDSCSSIWLPSLLCYLPASPC